MIFFQKKNYQNIIHSPMNQKHKYNSPYKVPRSFLSSPSRILTPRSSNPNPNPRSPFQSPRLKPSHHQFIENMIEGVKTHHNEVIGEMEIDRGSQYQGESVRISRLVLETLWIHFLGRSFRLEEAACDVGQILDGVKELRSDWSMMIKHYEGFQRRVARSVYKGVVEGEVDEGQLIAHLDRLVQQQQYWEIKIAELEKETREKGIKNVKKKQTEKTYYQTQTSPSKEPKYPSHDITQRLRRLNQQVIDSASQLNFQGLDPIPQCQTLQNQQPALLKKQSSKFNYSDVLMQSDLIQLPEKSKKYIQELIEIREEFGEQLASKEEILGQTLNVLGKAKKIIISYITPQSQKGDHSKLVADGRKVLEEISVLEKSGSQEKSIRSLGKADSIRENVEEPLAQPIQVSKVSESLSQSLQYPEEPGQHIEDPISHCTNLKTKRISKQTRFILLQQQLCKTIDQLGKEKIQNKLISEKLIVKQKQVSELESQNKELMEELSGYHQSYQQTPHGTKTPRNSSKPSQGMLAISELIQEPQQFDPQPSQSQQEHDSSTSVTQAVIGRRSNKLKSLFECLFPEEEGEKTTIKQIQKLRKEIENYNQNQSMSRTEVEDITPLQMVVLSLQNLLEHLSTLNEPQQNAILSSLKQQVVSITDEISSESEMSPVEFQQEIRGIMERVYESNDTPIRRQIQEFVFYLQGKNSEQLLYLVEQFVKRVGRVEFGESWRSSLDSSRMTSERVSRIQTPKNQEAGGNL